LRPDSVTPSRRRTREAVVEEAASPGVEEAAVVAVVAVLARAATS
jgi:hypothetical protein